VRVEVVTYDPAWPDQFDRVARALAGALAEVDVRAIEHVGSTSVPGLAAKPVLDIDVVVPRQSLLAAIAALERDGYRHRGDLGIPDRHALAAPDEHPRRNVYVCVEDSLALRNHLTVRDTLRRDAALRREYGELKLQLATKDWPDVDAYVRRKSVVLQRVLRAGGLGEGERRQVELVNADDSAVTGRSSSGRGRASS